MLNRALTTIEDSYPLPSDQILTNSICIDENGGVYVASNSRTPGGKGLMQKLICKDGKISTSQADGCLLYTSLHVSDAVGLATTGERCGCSV